jgi:Secretion system C-terminal sorting domain
MRLLIPLLVIAATAFGQIPNSGFENWSNNIPDSWLPNNALAATITQSTISYKGKYAVRGEVMLYKTTVLYPFVSAGTGGIGFATSGRPASLQGYYQLSPIGSDVFGVTVFLYSGGMTGTIVGGGAATFPNAVSAYTQFTVPITYYNSSTVDYCKTTFLISNSNSVNVGSYFLLDEITFSNSVGTGVSTEAQAPVVFALRQNYPDPFNPSTNISFSVPTTSFVTLSIFDALGREVSVVVSEVLPVGNYSRQWNAIGVPSGVYFYRLQTGSFTETRKLLLLR